MALVVDGTIEIQPFQELLALAKNYIWWLVDVTEGGYFLLDTY